MQFIQFCFTGLNLETQNACYKKLYFVVLLLLYVLTSECFISSTRPVVVNLSCKIGSLQYLKKNTHFFRHTSRFLRLKNNLTNFDTQMRIESQCTKQIGGQDICSLSFNSFVTMLRFRKRIKI